MSVLTRSSDQIDRRIVGEAGTEVVARVATFPGATTAAPEFCFLHGLVGLNEHWEHVAKSITDAARCTLLEIPLLRLRGKDCSIHGATSLTANFLEDHFDRPVTLVGNSFGGHVALKLALTRPDLVHSLVLAGSSGLLEKSQIGSIELRPSRRWLREKIGELFFDKDHVSDADIERAHAELSTKDGARAMVRLSRSARKDHLGDTIAGIAQPTLLVWGKEDTVTPPEAGRAFASLMPNSRMVWLDRCGHAPMIEQPEPFADAMRTFAHELRTAPKG
ncbi:MAG: alpha/beta hydrolase [Planctomycetota bacterium]